MYEINIEIRSSPDEIELTQEDDTILITKYQLPAIISFLNELKDMENDGG